MPVVGFLLGASVALWLGLFQLRGFIKRRLENWQRAVKVKALADVVTEVGAFAGDGTTNMDRGPRNVDTEIIDPVSVPRDSGEKIDRALEPWVAVGALRRRLESDCFVVHWAVSVFAVVQAGALVVAYSCDVTAFQEKAYVGITMGLALPIVGLLFRVQRVYDRISEFGDNAA